MYTNVIRSRPIVNSNFRGVSLVTLLVYVRVCNNQLLRDVQLINKNLEKLRIYEYNK